jgi:hypothetical protein
MLLMREGGLRVGEVLGLWLVGEKSGKAISVNLFEAIRLPF